VVTKDHVGTIAAPRSGQAGYGIALDVVDVKREVRGGRNLLNNITLSISPGELVAIAGGSGAGKTTLLNAMAGVAPPSSGRILYNGRDLYENLDEFRSSLGYVPQDDIIHKDLPLVTTLRYAARLRLPSRATAPEKESAVQNALEVLGLADRSSLPVKKLSGGQRKRASIGVELLTEPEIFFLDEPTSGLDPATSSELIRLMRRLADAGSTVVMTTHVIQDLRLCDKVIFLARDGQLAFCGRPELALEYFEASSYDEIYETLASEDWPGPCNRCLGSSEQSAIGTPQVTVEPQSAATNERPGSFGQWLVLTRRNLEMLWRSPLTLSILVGSPLMVIAMFAMLFKAGAFSPDYPSPSAAIMIIFWVAFGAFFFGLTYGLLQICTEFPIFFRERLVNLRILPYVASKFVVLAPLLVVVCILMLGVLRAFDRLPALGFEASAELTITLVLSAFAALALGLLTSALVSNTEQAMVAMPMLCFPQCLFAGAIVPVPIMAAGGKATSALMSGRWAFQGLGSSAGLNETIAGSNSPGAQALLAQYGGTFSGSVVETWLILCAFTVAFMLATWFVLQRKSRTSHTARRAIEQMEGFTSLEVNLSAKTTPKMKGTDDVGRIHVAADAREMAETEVRTW
jgi:ABC-type multidrug transport system ATPase subunit